jgi:acyl dehydratase
MEIPSAAYGPVESTNLVRFCGAWETFGPLHTYQKWCVERGYKDVLINGPLKQALLMTWIDNWAGNDGFLKALGCRHRAMDYHDDLLSTSGAISRKYEVNGVGYVDCEVRLINPRGEVSTEGSATAVLARRSGMPAPMEYDVPGSDYELAHRLASGSGKRIVEAEPGQGVGDLIPEAARNMIGMSGYSFTWPEPLDRSTIRRYCDATFEEKPIYRDEAYAKQSRYGALCAPPLCVVRVPFNERGIMGESAIPHVDLPGFTRTVNGGNEAEWFRPVKLGDTVTQAAYLMDIVQRTGRTGPILILNGETIYTNQRGEIVAKSRQATIRMP